MSYKNIELFLKVKNSSDDELKNIVGKFLKNYDNPVLAELAVKELKKRGYKACIEFKR